MCNDRFVNTFRDTVPFWGNVFGYLLTRCAVRSASDSGGPSAKGFRCLRRAAAARAAARPDGCEGGRNRSGLASGDGDRLLADIELDLDALDDVEAYRVIKVAVEWMEEEGVDKEHSEGKEDLGNRSETERRCGDNDMAEIKMTTLYIFPVGLLTATHYSY